MKAAQLTTYAKDFQLTVTTLPVPKIAADEVLVKVKAAAVNPLDQLIGSGSLRVLYGYARPVTMGNEIAGTVERLGSAVTDFQVGDAVYARLIIAKLGGFAEYVAVPARALAAMPSGLSFDQAVAVPLTGLTAYQALHEKLNLAAGATVFIPGGSGSFGQLAIPLAKAAGLKVIVSGNARSKQACLDLGADRYLDYREEDYWEVLHDVDAVIDTLGAQEIPHELAILKRGGQLLSLKAGPNKLFGQTGGFRWWQRVLVSLAGLKMDRMAQKQGVTYQFLFVRPDGQQLETVTKLVEQLHIVPAVDSQVYGLDDVNAAIQAMRTGKHRGKVILRFD